MRDMANTNAEPQPNPQRPARRLRFLPRIRPLVQTAFLGVWLAPLGRWLHGFPSCVFHCYACPLSSFACPVGVTAQFIGAGYFPFLAVGVVVAAAALVGSLICGWACPFGFLQDLAARVPTPRIAIPKWMGALRYAVLIGMVIAIPLVLHLQGKSAEESPLFICRSCPAGAVEGALPYIGRLAYEGKYASWTDIFDPARGGTSPYKWTILAVFFVAIFVTYRPWCRVLCPLGGFLSLFNRFSVLHLRFEAHNCTECNLCRSRCVVGVEVERKVNDPACIRCLECTACGAITPTLAGPKPQ
jgi:ferredoxin-type protein NapH